MKSAIILVLSLEYLGTANVTSSLLPKPHFCTQESPKSNTKNHANSNLAGKLGLKDIDENQLLLNKVHIYLLVFSHTSSTSLLPSESLLEDSMSYKVPLTELVFHSSEHTIKSQTPAAQNAANIP
ncbi:hypothetical protein O181_001324 [Austropuccinia psidii MF-1]|uniref:Uncharacterized protein n=1 Tax=Austropuccinia psidii MF-1 TaxID=1389203 RepID=A0A9Q3BAA6_9BASI|nr:hypothetical protein [Austropuccinia psidii MF-1]